MNSHEIVIYFTDELPANVLEQIEKLKGEVGKSSTLSLLENFKATTVTGTPPMLSALYCHSLLSVDKGEDVMELKKSLMAVNQLELIETEAFPRRACERLHPVEVENVSQSPLVRKIEFNGVTYEKTGSPSDRPSDDTCILPWQIKIGEVVFQRTRMAGS